MSIGIGTSVSGTISSGAEQDLFNVSLVAGQNYIFDVTGGTLADPTLGLRNANGTQVAFNYDGGPGLNPRIEFTA